MKYAVVQINPFLIKQTIYIYQDGNKIETLTTDLTTLAEGAVNLFEKEEIKDIHLVGSKLFAQNIKKNMMKYQESKYNKKDLNIDII